MQIVRIAVLSILALVLCGVASSKGHAQSLSTASKGAEISAFGGYVLSSTDYGPFAPKGIGAGVDFTIFPKFPVAPSLEIRGHEAFGTDATEKAVLVGLRVQKDIRDRYHPYGDFLVGGSEIVYHPAPAPDYRADRSKAYSYGGGINIDVAWHLSAKFDFQKQSWNLGSTGRQTGSGDYILSPTTFLVGVTYTVPFRRLSSRSGLR